MRWFLACTLLVVAGCGEPVEGQGQTVVTITFPGPELFPETRLSCPNDPPPSGGEFYFNYPCEVHGVTGDWSCYFGPPAGPCTLLIGLRNEITGERICVQEEDFVVSAVGDTEVEITLDDCEPVTTLLSPPGSS